MVLPKPVRRFALPVLFLACLVLIALAFAPPGPASAQTAQPQSNGYVIVGWNNLGMHCYDPDFADLAILPPFNTLWVQVLQVGEPPQVVTQGVEVRYSFPDNTYSTEPKSNFWDYAQQLFGLPQPLPPNVGLTGKGLSGSMDPVGDHFEAVGIPLTEYLDSDLVNRYPFQKAEVVAYDAATGEELAEQTIVAPVSSELNCMMCHCDDCDATTRYPIVPTGKVETNILTLHDYLSQSQYPPGHTTPLMDRRPVLCAECHPDNALGLPGVAPVKDLAYAMHNHHKDLPDITPDTAGCYNCHPGPETQCLRDVMSQDMAFQCPDCHGLMADVANNPYHWNMEPSCDNPSCHGAGYQLTNALYRNSQGHGNLYCPACHDSTHAVAPSREANDGIKFVNLQGNNGTLRDCAACHGAMPAGRFVHSATLPAPTATLHLRSTKMTWAMMGKAIYRVTTGGFVDDQDRGHAAGVAVRGTWTYPDGSVSRAVVLTDRTGHWRVSVTSTQLGLYQFDVTDLFLSGYTYDLDANESNPHSQLMVR